MQAHPVPFLLAVHRNQVAAQFFDKPLAGYHWEEASANCSEAQADNQQRLKTEGVHTLIHAERAATMGKDMPSRSRRTAYL